MEGETELAPQVPADEDVKLTTDEVVEPKPEGEEPPEEVASDDKPEGDDEDKEERKRPSGAERAKRRLQMAQAEIDRMARELDELRKPPNKEGKPGIDREPTEADFPNDFFAYERARTAWEVRQAIREESSRGKEARQQEVQRELNAARREAYEEDRSLVRERIPDFDKVVSGAAQMHVSDALAAELMASERPALLQYHLAQNPDKVRELNQMSGAELARAIGRLEARVHLPSGKKATEASPPPQQPRGKAAPPANLHTADMDTYVAMRRKEMEASRR